MLSVCVPRRGAGGEGRNAGLPAEDLPPREIGRAKECNARFFQNKPAPTGGICCSGGRGPFSVIFRSGSAPVRLPSRSAELDALPHRIRDRNCIVLMRATVISIEKLYLTGPFPFSAWPAPRPRRSMRRKPDTSPPARRPRPWAARSGRPWRWPCPASRPPWPPCG